MNTANETVTAPASALAPAAAPAPRRHLGHRHLPRQRRLQGPAPDGLARARPPGPRHGHRLHRRARPHALARRRQHRRARHRHARAQARRAPAQRRLPRRRQPPDRDVPVDARRGAVGRGRRSARHRRPDHPRRDAAGHARGRGAAARDPGPVGQHAGAASPPAPHQPQGLGPQVEPRHRGGRRGRRRRGRHRDRRRDRRAQGADSRAAWGDRSSHRHQAAMRRRTEQRRRYLFFD